MKAGVVVFPGSNCDQDCYHVANNVAKMDTVWLWHRDRTIPEDIGLIVLPGGFTYGDYLRAGAIAHTATIMPAIKEFAARGGHVIGICNGFQILTESGLLPGALMRNRNIRFVCRTVPLRVERQSAPWTDFPERVINVPIAHGQGNYFIDAEGLARLKANNQILFRYCTPDGEISDAGNPNGSIENIAGIANEAGNVLGMMPHPERCSELALGNADGLGIWNSIRRVIA
jgi:phosphoribosylformylglycinamidine synthase I